MSETTPLPADVTYDELAEAPGPAPYLDRPVLVTLDEAVLTRAQAPRSWVAGRYYLRPSDGPVRLAGDVPNRVRFEVTAATTTAVVVRYSHSEQSCTRESGISTMPSQLGARGEVWAAVFDQDPQAPDPAASADVHWSAEYL